MGTEVVTVERAMAFPGSPSPLWLWDYLIFIKLPWSDIADITEQTVAEREGLNTNIVSSRPMKRPRRVHSLPRKLPWPGALLAAY
jgi:hypothetical protein